MSDIEYSVVTNDVIKSFTVSVNNRVISPFREDFIFTYAKFCKNKTLAKISEFTVIQSNLD